MSHCSALSKVEGAFTPIRFDGPADVREVLANQLRIQCQCPSDGTEAITMALPLSTALVPRAQQDRTARLELPLER